jgi:GMP synthase-like glutamine amidotransferase
MKVQLTETGACGVFFDGLPEEFKCLQWHSSEVTRLPSDAEVLSSSPACVAQALKWGTRAYSVQFHLEVEDDTVKNWANIPAYAAALEVAVGDGGLEVLVENCIWRV